MSAQEDTLATLLGSPSYRRCQERAAELLQDAAALRALVRGVEEKRFPVGQIDDAMGKVNIDIACAIVESRIEVLESEEHLGDDDQETAQILDRLKIFVAALTYYVLSDDVVPDTDRDGHTDDLVLLTWVAQVARAQFPVIGAGGATPPPGLNRDQGQ